MAELSKIRKNGVDYDIKDSTARAAIDEIKKNGSGWNVENGIPSGGKAGQFLCKKSDEDYDVEWADFVIPEQYGLITYDQDKTITII